MQRVKGWSIARVSRFLRDFYGVEPEYDEYMGDWSYLSPETPEVYYDPHTGRLTITFPNEDEEIPNPYSRKFYPDFEWELEHAGDPVEVLSEWLDEDEAKRIVDVCKNDHECIAELAYEAYQDHLEAEMKKEIESWERTKPEKIVLCGVPVIKQIVIYEDTRSDGVVEYTAYFPAEQYVIDLSKVPDEKTLECILKNL